MEISGKLVTNISDVVIASVHSEKTRLKKMIMIIGERAKRARHSQVCSIEIADIYIIYYYIYMYVQILFL